MKQMCPKGSVSSDMWRQISRSVDKVHKLVSRGSALLNYSEQHVSGFTDVGKEIVDWRGFLRNSEYLQASSINLVNIFGEPLNPSLVDIIEMMKLKRKEYFAAALSIPLKNIRYANIKITSDDLATEITPFSLEYDYDDDVV